MSFQCPNCGVVYQPDRNDITERIFSLKTKHARLQKQMAKLNELRDENNLYPYKVEKSRLRTEILVTEHLIRGLNAELKGDPCQMWQLRYSKVMEIAKSYMTVPKYTKFKQDVDEACRPKVD